MTEITLRPACDIDLKRLRAWGKRSAIWQLHADHRQGLQPKHLEKSIDTIYSHLALKQSVAFVAEQGAITCGVAIATQTPNPFDHSPSGILHTLIINKRWQSEGICCRLLSAIEMAALKANWSLIQADTGFWDSDANKLFNSTEGWELGWVTVRKRLGMELPNILRNAKVKIRRAHSEDLTFIKKLWFQAVRNGLSYNEENLYNLDQIQAAADNTLNSILNSESVVVVAEDKQQKLGYAISKINSFQQLTGRYEATLYDSFVLPEHRNSGVATTLTASVEALAILAGRSYINGLVRGDTPTQTELIIKNLELTGWLPFQRCFRKVLL